MLAFFWPVLLFSLGLVPFRRFFLPRLNGIWIFLTLMVGIPLAVVFNMFVYSGILHLMLLMVRGGKGGYQSTFRVVAYSQAALLWNIIPFMGSWIATVWKLVIQIIGLHEIHHISYSRVIMAFLLPAFFLFILIIVAHGPPAGASVLKFFRMSNGLWNHPDPFTITHIKGKSFEAKNRLRNCFKSSTTGSGHDPFGAGAGHRGAGSGKTRTLIYRVARLVETGIPPEAILLLTFTRKSAQEMLNRASELSDKRCRFVSGGTFHALAFQGPSEPRQNPGLQQRLHHPGPVRHGGSPSHPGAGSQNGRKSRPDFPNGAPWPTSSAKRPISNNRLKNSC
jgi:hypothetical protein